MGAWGTGISSNDTFKDVYADFFDLYNKEYNVDDISKELISKYDSVITDSDEANDFYFALSKAKWDCGLLDNDLLQKIKMIIETGNDLKRWEDLGASKADLSKRKQVLQVFYNKLLEENTKPKKPKKIKLRDSIFHKGDCLSIDLQNGNYGASIVLTEQLNSELGLNLLLVVDYYSSGIPKRDDFLNGYCLMNNSFKNTAEPFFIYCYAKFFKKSKYKFDIVDNIDIKIKYDNQNGMYSYGHWDYVGDRISYVNTEGEKISKKQKIRKYVHKGLFF